MNQIQIHEERTLDKARVIAASKRVRRSEANSNIWLVGSGNPKTPSKFYKIIYDESLDMFMCDCKAYEFSSDNRCIHIYAAAIHEGEGSSS